MRKVIDPGVPATIEYTCDGCGLPVSTSAKDMDLGKEYCLAIEGSFGYLSPNDGFNYKLELCGECGVKATKAIEQTLGMDIYPGFGLNEFFQE